MAEPYYTPSQIRWLRDDVMWMIENVLPLDAGEWPPDPAESGYTGSQKLSSQSAPFEKASIVRAELEQRIKMTKADGETLVWEIQKGGVEYYDLLCPAAKNALNYITSGVKRREQSYAEWLRNRKTRRVTDKLGENLWNSTKSLRQSV